MTAPHPYLIIDNTRPIDPTLPDNFDPIDNLEVSPVAVLAAIAGGILGRAFGRASGWAFWVALGVVAGLMIA